jgi:dihydroorotase
MGGGGAGGGSGAILIANGRVVDPASGRDELADVRVEGGAVRWIRPCGRGAAPAADGARVIDARGLVVAPGLIDLHVHFREPGACHKEDLRSGAMAAARGGYTTVCCMPNTKPAIDCAGTLEALDRRGREEGLVNLLAAGAMTVGQLGVELADLRGMAGADTRCRELTGAGVCAFTEDGRTLMDEGLMRRVALEALALGLPVMDHAEDSRLSGGAVNDGPAAARLGVRGVPARAETEIVARDVRLAAETGCRMHIQHVSAEGSVELVRQAKSRGLPVTAETAPHYFALTEEAVLRLGSNAKMNPPLRGEADRRAVAEGLADGTIDVIATDHAPHGWAEKSAGVEKAPFGVIGLETAFAVSYTVLVEGGRLSLAELLDKMSAAPARLAGISRGALAEGEAADIVALDLGARYALDSASFASKARNTPFDGMAVCGRIAHTICGGRLTYSSI